MDAPQHATMACPFCGETIPVSTLKCPRCREIVAASRRVGTPLPAARQPSSIAVPAILLIAVGILILVVTTFVLDQRRLPVSNDVLAMAALKQLANNEEKWGRTDPDGDGAHDYWTRDVAAFYYCKDNAGVPLKFIDLALANADKNGLSRYSKSTPAPKSGYWYSAIPLDANGKPYCAKGKDENPSAYGFCAWPARYNTTGVRTYIVDESGVIYCMDIGGKPIDRWPGADPTTQGWIAAD